MLRNVTYFPEPLVLVGHGQRAQHPRDGLYLAGPLMEAPVPRELRAGVIGTANGIDKYSRWVTTVANFIPAHGPGNLAPFPGFHAAFGFAWPTHPTYTATLSKEDILKEIHRTNRHEAVYNTVSMYVDEIQRYVREEDQVVDLWFLLLPEAVYRYGRPEIPLPAHLRHPSSVNLTRQRLRMLQRQVSLFADEEMVLELSHFAANFHHQLKARLLGTGAVVQLIRESTLDASLASGPQMRGHRQVQDLATVAWNLSTTTFFKVVGRPWKLADVREGVCYVGLVFKQDDTQASTANACCGAQLFLDSGDGVVFKGAVGPWYSEAVGEYHLSPQAASELMSAVMSSYRRVLGHEPKEVFIHGKARFWDDEWSGFEEATPRGTRLVGIRIRDDERLKGFAPDKMPVPRGMAWLPTSRSGYLWTKGYIARLNTYPGFEVPNPLSIEICRGQARLPQVMRDILGLTKVNFNTCNFGDGLPVTLRFADAVGDILTSVPTSTELRAPLPFKHYI